MKSKKAIKVGDILLSHWGQTIDLLSFVRVEKITPSKVSVVELENKKVNNSTTNIAISYGNDWFVPGKVKSGQSRRNADGDWLLINHDLTPQLNAIGGDMFFLKRLRRIYTKWDGKPKQQEGTD